MARVLSVLEDFLEEMEKDNPYRLVLKGGTCLSLFYLNHHRESEDLDFDSDISNLKNYRQVENYFIGILGKLKEKQIIKDFKLGKRGLAATARYHMKLELETYKTFQTKIDVDFVDLPKKLEQKGELCFYTKERIFIAKMIAFTNRREFKDLYDLSYLLPKIDPRPFAHNLEVIKLIDGLIRIIGEDDVVRLYRSAFRNVDLRFRDLKQSEVGSFVSKFVTNLRILRNKLS